MTEELGVDGSSRSILSSFSSVKFCLLTFAAAAPHGVRTMTTWLKKSYPQGLLQSPVDVRQSDRQLQALPGLGSMGL